MCIRDRVGADDGLGQGLCLFHALAAYRLHFEKSGGAFPVSGDLFRQIYIYPVKGFFERFILCRSVLDLRVLRQAICQKQHCIVGGSVPVHRDHIVGVLNVFA